MDLQNDNLPDRPLKRFYVGFAVTGLMTFIGCALYSESLKEIATSAIGFGLVLGLIGGVVAAFGKKWLRCVVTLAVEIISNP